MPALPPPVAPLTKDRAPLADFARAIAFTRAGMVLERGLRAFWPALTVGGLAFAGTVFVPEIVGPGVRGWLAAGSAIAAVAALGWGLWRFRWPGRNEAIQRLDHTLPGRPLTALTDPLALGDDDPAVRALWQAHLRQMMRVAQDARAVAPDPDLAPRDPYGLRMTGLAAVVIALIFGSPAALFGPAHKPGAPGSAEAAMGATWEGWASPPRYTGKPGLYLNAVEGDTLSVPEGTRFAFRFYGAPATFSESVSNPAEIPTDSDPGAREFEAVRSGVIEVAGRTFQIAVAPDAAPTVELIGLAERRADGKLAQPFRATDDYGVTAGQAHVTLDLAAVSRRYGLTVDPEPREDLVYDLPLPFSGSRADFTEQLIEDAAKHPWANLPVRLTLDVEDGLAQKGSSGAQGFELPGRRFFDPRAAALIEMRRDLLWSRANAPGTAEILRAITNRPENFLPNPAMAATIRMAAQRLEQSEVTPATRDEIAEMLWQMAELLEDGGLPDALAAMQQAQQRLSEAMRNGASKDEIAKLMQELKEATDRYMQMLAERSQQEDGPQFGQQQQGQQITGDQIQQMMDEIQRLMEEGRMAEAQELLDQLARMMENMRVTQGQGEGQGQNPSMRDLGQALRDQQELSDEAFRQLQQGQGEGQGQQGQGDLADRQGDLRREIDRQRGMMPHLDGDAGEAARRQLDEAGRAMDGAEQALRDGDNGSALDRQADAIEALREGMRNMRDALSQEQQGSQPGGTPGTDGQEQRFGDPTTGRGGREMPRDPLGRATGDGGRATSDSEFAQGEDVYRRARDLLDEIRRRSAERLRPDGELDYLRRLLDRFGG